MAHPSFHFMINSLIVKMYTWLSVDLLNILDDQQCSASDCPPPPPPPHPANELVFMKVGGYDVNNKWSREVELYSSNATCNTRLKAIPADLSHPVRHLMNLAFSNGMHWKFHFWHTSDRWILWEFHHYLWIQFGYLLCVQTRPFMEHHKRRLARVGG